MLFVVLFGVLEPRMIFAGVQRVCETELSRAGNETHTIFVSQLKWLAIRVIPPLVQGRHGIFRENLSAFLVQFWSWMDNWDVLYPIFLVSAMPSRNVLVFHCSCGCRGGDNCFGGDSCCGPGTTIFQTRHGTESTFDQPSNARDAPLAGIGTCCVQVKILRVPLRRDFQNWTRVKPKTNSHTIPGKQYLHFPSPPPPWAILLSDSDICRFREFTL